MIEIKKWIEPDLSIVMTSPRYGDNHFEKYSFLFKDQLMVVQDCKEDGTIERYSSSNKYYACKVMEDKIYVCIPSHGWIPAYKDIQDKYRDEIAEKVLLGE